MAKLIVQHDEDPGMAIMISERTESGATEYWGVCNDCGRFVSQFDQTLAIEDAQAHIDQHESGL